jgi:hypothetical protein
MPHRRPRDRSSSLRRLRYALFRVGYVGWRALWREEAAWHALIGLAIALGCATGVVMWDRQGGLPVIVYALPVAAAGVYGVWIITSRFRRVWNEFRQLRRDMQRRRKLDLLTGGVRRRQFERLTFLRVRVPFVLVPLSGAAFISWLTGGRRGRAASAVADLAAVAAMAVLSLATMWVTHRWNEKHRPRELRRYCPRCGYDLTQSPHRCPECGLRKLELPPSEEPWW